MLRNKTKRMCFLILLAASFAVLAACGGQNTANEGQVSPVEPGYQEVPGGDAIRGQQAIVDYGCHSCHTIPGIAGADALVGPPLNDWADRHYIAGSLPNTTDNLLRWIMDPQEIEPGNAMPDMRVEDEAARDIAAYLYTLRR
jgi:cytochrome c1